MADFLSPGAKVSQVKKGPVVAPTIATAISGFLLYTEKGPVGKPTLVTSPDDAKEVFGGRKTSPFLSRLTDTLIDYFGEGGASCYVTRYIGDGSAVAARTLQTQGGASHGSLTSNAGSFPVQLVDGDTFVGSVNGGAGTTVTVNATPATYVGTGGTYAPVTAGHTLTVSIVGIAGNQVITFTGAEATQAAFVSSINAQLRGAAATMPDGDIHLETDRMGSSAAGNIVAGDADVLASLGFSVAAFTNAGPNNVANVDAVTAAEFASLAVAYTGSTTVANANNSVTWQSNTTGSGSSVRFTSGTGVSKVAGFDNSTHSGSSTVATNTISLTAASGTDASPGAWGNGYSVKSVRKDTTVTTAGVIAAGVSTTLPVASSARLSIGDTISVTKAADTQRAVISGINGTTLTLAASITVPSGGYSTENVVLETFEVTVYDESGFTVFPSPFRNLRMSSLAGKNYFVNAINSAARTPINAENLSSAATDPRPVTDTVAVNLSGGSDGSAPTYAEVEDQVTTIRQAPDVMFWSCPGCVEDFGSTNGASIQRTIANYLVAREDAMAIFSVGSAAPATGTGGSRDFVENTLNISNSLCAMYWPWVKRLDAVTGLVTAFPPEPYVQGMIARSHKTRGFGKAPAGTVTGLLQTVIGAVTLIEEQSAEYDDMYPAGVNAILNFPGSGIAVFGSRTLDVTGEFGQVNVQTVFCVAHRQVKELTRFVAFENNDPDTRATVTRVLSGLFRQWRADKILQGAKDDEAFFVICNESNNTPAIINKGKLICRVGLAVQRPAEFLDFTLELDTRAIDQAAASV